MFRIDDRSVNWIFRSKTLDFASIQQKSGHIGNIGKISLFIEQTLIFLLGFVISKGYGKYLMDKKSGNKVPKKVQKVQKVQIVHFYNFRLILTRLSSFFLCNIYIIYIISFFILLNRIIEKMYKLDKMDFLDFLDFLDLFSVNTFG